MEDEKFKRAFAIIETHGKNIFNAVNYEMVTMYYELGEYIFGELELKRWGDNTIQSLSKSIKETYPELKGCSPRGLYRMVQFYKTYRHNVIVSPLVAQISWTNNVIIFFTLLVNAQTYFQSTEVIQCQIFKNLNILMRFFIKASKML